MAGRTLVSVLKSEQEHGIKGGIYGRLQVDFAYNSNHMEGSTLSHEQTQYIYDTRTGQLLQRIERMADRWGTWLFKGYLPVYAGQYERYAGLL